MDIFEQREVECMWTKLSSKYNGAPRAFAKTLQDSDLALQPYSLMTLHAKLLQAFKLGVIHVLGFTDYQSTG